MSFRVGVLCSLIAVGCGSDASSGDSDAGERPDTTGPEATAQDASSGDTQADIGRVGPDVGPVPGVEDLDYWLPHIPAEDCALEEPMVPEFDLADFTPKTVCASGCDFTTLGDAVDAAEPYDDIQLAPGDYDECIETRVSPLAIRGVGGAARFHDVVCEGTNTILNIRSPHVVLENLDIRRFRQPNPAESGAWFPFAFHPDVEQAIVSRVWLQDIDYVVRAAGSGGGQLWFDRMKVQNAGWKDRHSGHPKGLLSVATRERVWVTGSVFSNFARDSWLLSTSNNPHVEFTCNVIDHNLDPPDYSQHFFHAFYPRRMVFRGNYFYEANGTLPLYIYYTSRDEPPLIELHANTFLFDNEEASFLGIIHTSSVIAVDNYIVGGEPTDLDSRTSPTEHRRNAFVPSREEAGYEPGPGIPSSWPVRLE